jgi:pimeloyl-ACP methyl ester carboxylesterase
MHVAEAGHGPPVVLLHGWPQNWWTWRGVIPRLAGSHRVICPDLRGFGWSDAPPRGYDKETLAHDVLRLLDALELDRVSLVGHDWGGFVGYLLALHHPERIERYLALNIIHPWPRAQVRDVLNVWRLSYQWVMAAPVLGRLTARHGRRVLGRLLRAGLVDQSAMTDEDLDIFLSPLAEPDRTHVSVQVYRTFQLQELLPLARGRYRSLRLTVPTRVLFGTGDVVMTADQMDGYQPYADDMAVELVPGCGHFIADERPDLVADRALAFFGPREGAAPRPA